MPYFVVTCETCGTERRVFRAATQAPPRFCSNACRFDRNGKTPAEILERFIDRSAGTDKCWPFRGPVDAKGYGVINYDGGKLRAHRVAWELVNGAITDDRIVCHECDNPPCCNPAHHFLGTDTENAADRHSKGREPIGDEHMGAKIRAEDIPVIRALQGVTRAGTVGIQYGVHADTIRAIWHRKSWRHVP